jgi:para-aminobenzoate synthetase/4-amino-4-deoxychorismate lyase
MKKLPEKSQFSLIESMLHDSHGYFLFKAHLNRLASSAEEFGVELDIKQAVRLLKKEGLMLNKNKTYKTKLVVSLQGAMRIESVELKADNTRNRKAAISRARTNSRDLFLRHKTSCRDVYDREYSKYLKKGFYDVIFFNEKSELTEAHSSNVFLKKDGILYTPPVLCGLLPGTYRQRLLEKGRGKCLEKVLYKRDLLEADSVWIGNSVRGLREIKLK